LTLREGFDTFEPTHLRNIEYLPIHNILGEFFMKPSEFRFTLLLALTSAALFFFALALSGCGTVQEGMTDEDWTNTPPVSVTARLEYRIDSLENENRKLQQQLETASSENRNLSARNTELEGRLTEVSGTSRTASGTPPFPARSGSVSGGYEAALAKFRNREFQEAVDQFSGLLSTGISSDLADNCEYWVGESYFGMKKYNEAIQYFQNVTAIAGSDKADDAQFMIGNSYQMSGNKSAAREAYQKLMSSYPSSPLIKRARAKMNNL
jgi:TolA-binding protein